MALGLGLTFAATGASAAPTVTDVPEISVASAATTVAVVAPITVPSGSGGILDAETLADYTEPLGLLTRQLDALADKSVAIAIDPMILASIRVLGTTAPESALTWLERLSLVSNEVVPLPYAQNDVTLATQAGSGATFEPISFDFALNASNFADPATATAVPTPAATGQPQQLTADGVPLYPTTQDLLEWDYAIDGFLLPRTDTIVDSDLAAFTASGYSTIVASSSNIARPAGAGSVTTIDGVTALVADSAVADAMDVALGSTLDRDVAAANTALNQAVLTAGAAQTTGTASVLIVIDHSLEFSAARLDAALVTLSTSPSITLVPLTTLASTPATSATIDNKPHTDAQIGDVGRLLTAEQEERTFFAIADDPAALVAQRRLALLDVLGTVTTANPADWLTEVNRFLVDSRDTRNAVGVVDASNYLIVANNGFLPVSVSNNLNQAVTVYITVNPRSGLLAVDDSRVELRVEANSQAKGDIPVQSLSNGVVDVEITLTSGTGVSVGTTTVSEINVQAGWETPIVLSLGALVVIVFAVGLVRSIVSRRKPVNE
ncbi:DUF6049 family protein [Rhodoglobus sp. NPDC076762]